MSTGKTHRFSLADLLPLYQGFRGRERKLLPRGYSPEKRELTVVLSIFFFRRLRKERLARLLTSPMVLLLAIREPGELKLIGPIYSVPAAWLSICLRPKANHPGSKSVLQLSIAAQWLSVRAIRAKHHGGGFEPRSGSQFGIESPNKACLRESACSDPAADTFFLSVENTQKNF